MKSVMQECTDARMHGCTNARRGMALLPSHSFAFVHFCVLAFPVSPHLRSDPNVLLQTLGRRFATIDVSIAVDGDELRAIARGRPGVAPWKLDEPVHPSAL